MLDLKRLKNMKLSRVPKGQLIMANGIFAFDYRFPRRTRIDIEGLENLPTDRPTCIAMNHTDRYNYWPFQFMLYRKLNRFTATWVKGKYYENNAVGWFMDQTNNIPLPSRGYIISTEFRATMQRKPSGDEYRALRDLADGPLRADEPPELPEGVRRFLQARGGVETFLVAFGALFDEMMEEVLRLCRETFEMGQYLLVFPQGTRSKRLPRGHTGLIQVAQHLRADVVPVGCNGSDRAYPSSRPFALGGHIVYRVGAPLRWDGPEFSPHRPSTPYRPFSREATAEHGDRFRAMTDLVMDRINALLDPEYQYAPDRESDGVDGMARFL